MLAPWKKSYDQSRCHIKKQRHYFANKGPSCQCCGFSSSPVDRQSCNSAFPSQIETVLLNEGYEPNYQIIVDRVNNTDTFEVNVEMTAQKFTDKVGNILNQEKALAAAMRAMLGINLTIHLVALKRIARSKGKAVRVIELIRES